MKIRHFLIIILGVVIFFAVANAFVYSQEVEKIQIEKALKEFGFPKETEEGILRESNKFLADSMQEARPEETKGKVDPFAVLKCPNKKCGLGVEEDDSFCSNCGAKLNKKGRNAVIIKQLMKDIKKLDELDNKIAVLERQYIENHRKVVSKEIQRKESMIRTLEENLRLPNGYEYGAVVGISKDGHLVVKTPDSAYPPDYEHQRTFSTKIPHY